MCFAYVIWDHFKVKCLEQPLALEECYEKGHKLAEIFRSEHIQMDKLDK